MKWMVFVLAVLALLLAGCSRLSRADTEVIDGGQNHLVDENAPKVIESTVVTAFSCAFSTTDIPLNESPVAGRYFTLYASQEGGSFEARAGGEVYKKRSFAPDFTFFEQLQEIISRYDLAQYNGQYYTVAGLPPDLGGKLDVQYASGERIRASDNQSSFLPLEAMEELVALFDPNYKRQE